jgi:hypothetical protein
MSGRSHSQVSPPPLLWWFQVGSGFNEWKVALIWDRVGQVGERRVSSDGKAGEWKVDIRGSKVVVPTCVN